MGNSSLTLIVLKICSTLFIVFHQVWGELLPSVDKSCTFFRLEVLLTINGNRDFKHRFIQKI